jgi:hypothetical protein
LSDGSIMFLPDKDVGGFRLGFSGRGIANSRLGCVPSSMPDARPSREKLA